MREANVEEATYVALSTRLSAAFQASFYRACSRAGLTPTKFLALEAMDQVALRRMSDLAQHLGLTPGAATTLVDRLVRHGLAERSTDAQDRRVVTVQPSAAGLAALNEARRLRSETTHAIFKTLDPTLRAQLLDGLDALVDVWETHIKEQHA